MADKDNVEIKNLKEPINFTDPFVLHDSMQNKPFIAQLYTPNEMVVEDDNKIGNYNKAASIKTYGMRYPIIQLNTIVINYTKIHEMIIHYDNFLTTIKLVINDADNYIKSFDIPTLNNMLDVIIVPEVENTYKSISLRFKITSFDSKDSYLIYYGKLYIPEFNKKIIKELQYKACNNVKGKISVNKNITDNTTISCNNEDNKRPNTWEMLHIIAKECNLGFSSTEQCKEIKDCLPRLIYNKNYEDFINQQIQFSGLDEESVFDAWIDLYGYLVMVNVAWVLNNKSVVPENLGIYAFTGAHMTDDINVPEQQSELVMRILTNKGFNSPPNNMMIRKFNPIVNNSDLIFGTSVSMYNFSLLDINDGNNSINQYDIDVKRNSIDEQYKKYYAVEYQEKLTIECNDLPINKQKLIRNKFFSKYRQRLLEVELDQLNLGLQRGTLINITIFDDTIVGKNKLTAQTSNAISPNNTTTPDMGSGDDITDKNIVENQNMMMLNSGLSGMYYIDSMRFEYRCSENKIRQFISLIKKGNISNINNHSTPPKFNMHDYQKKIGG